MAQTIDMALITSCIMYNQVRVVVSSYGRLKEDIYI